MGGVDLRGQVELPILPEEVEARVVLPLGTGKADAASRDRAPLDAAVDGLYKSDFALYYSCTHRYLSTVPSTFAQGIWQYV